MPIAKIHQGNHMFKQGSTWHALSLCIHVERCCMFLAVCQPQVPVTTQHIASWGALLGASSEQTSLKGTWGNTNRCC